MKIPLEWLKNYLQIKKSPKEIAESFTALGLMLDKPVENIVDESEMVLDLEHRMDRSDWLSVIGCARDLAAFENLKLNYPQSYTKKGKKPAKNQIVDIKVTCPDVVFRFNTRVFRGIKVKESPAWLKKALNLYGMPSINNIVDITNYVMVEYGQPLHAQDLKKLEKQEIVIRKAKKGEKITTLLGEEVELDPEIFVLTQNDHPTVVGGIVGGKTTGVDETTKDIVLDAGNYSQVSIRKTSRKLKIQNETVARTDKFLHPELTEIALNRATQLILDLAGGDYYENIDWYPKQVPLKKLNFRMSRLEKISGMTFDIQDIKKVLKNLEYTILKEKKDEMEIEVPYFRTDVEVEDDIVADILRISDYKNIPSSLMQSAPPKEITTTIYKFENKLRDILVSLGLHEHITDPMVIKDESNKEQIVLQNALTFDKSALRTTIYQTLKVVCDSYKKHKINEIGIFEVGKVYEKTTKEYKENRVVQVIYKNEELDLVKNSNEVKKILAGLLENLGINNMEMRKSDREVHLYIEGSKVGELTIDSFYLLTEKLLEHTKQAQRVVSEFENKTTEDLSLLINKDQYFGKIYQAIKDYRGISNVEVLNEYITKEGKKSVLVRMEFASDDIKETRTNIINLLKKEFSVDFRE